MMQRLPSIGTSAVLQCLLGLALGVSLPAWGGWTERVDLIPEANFSAGPVFDANGNAFVVGGHFAEGQSNALKLFASSGPAALWMPLPPPHSRSDTLSYPSLVADAAGKLTMVGVGVGPVVRVERYRPDTGWDQPVDLAGSWPFGIQKVQAASVGQGDVVAVGCAGTAEVWVCDLTAWTFNASAGQWSGPTVIAPAVSSHSNDVFMLTTSPGGGFASAAYAHAGPDNAVGVVRYDAATRVWGPPQAIPGTRAAAGSATLPTISSAVDDGGNTTVFSVSLTGRSWSLMGFREQRGRWAKQTLIGRSESAAPYVLVPPALDSKGGVWSGILQAVPGTTDYVLPTSVRYTPATGWLVEPLGQYAAGFCCHNADFLPAAQLSTGQAVLTYVYPAQPAVNTTFVNDKSGWKAILGGTGDILRAGPKGGAVGLARDRCGVAWFVP